MRGEADESAISADAQCALIASITLRPRIYNSRALPLDPGTRIGSFEIRSRLGAGGMGEVMPDGRRFLMVKQAGAADSTEGDSFIVVQNWLQELKRLAPRK
jgi:hypothetical protein